MTQLSRSALAHLSDDRLLAQCEVDTYRASGPGGQKRNKTSSAVRIRHPATGLIVIAEESRSQHENRARALGRLRQSFYLKLREPIAAENLACLEALRGGDGRLHVVSRRAPHYWDAVGVLLDLFEVHGGQVRETAHAAGTTTGNLLTVLELDDKVWAETNAVRQRFGHKALRTGS